MAAMVEKVLKVGGLFLSIISLILGKFLFFWNYNPSPNGQIIYSIDAQAHL